MPSLILPIIQYATTGNTYVSKFLKRFGLYLLFVVPHVDMSGTPNSTVHESQPITLICTTSTAASALSIAWTRAHKFEQLNEENHLSEHGNFTRSRLTITADRQLNDQIYQCCLDDFPQICSESWRISVRCKCLS